MKIVHHLSESLTFDDLACLNWPKVQHDALNQDSLEHSTFPLVERNWLMAMAVGVLVVVAKIPSNLL